MLQAAGPPMAVVAPQLVPVAVVDRAVADQQPKHALHQRLQPALADWRSPRSHLPAMHLR